MESEEVEEFAERYRMTFVEVSTQDCEKVDNVFISLATNIIKRKKENAAAEREIVRLSPLQAEIVSKPCYG